MQKKNPNSTRNVASNLVLDLARGGYLNRGEFKGGRNLSVVTILQEGEKLVTEVLEPLRIALTDTPEGKALRDKWRNIPWEEYAPKALAIHKESSNKGNSINNSTSLIKINEIILQNPGIRTTDIMKTLKESGLPHKAINMYINKLIETGKIIREKEPNNITRWYPAISS
jgi:predicted transcriptional regulator